MRKNSSHLENQRDERVVIVPKADVYPAPQEGLAVMAVHDGLEVEIRRQDGEFCEIKIGEGTIGWVKISDLSGPI